MVLWCCRPIVKMEPLWASSILIIVYIHLEYVPLVHGQCWKPEIENCEAHISKYMPKANIKYYSRSELEHFCSSKVKYDTCIKGLLPYCQEEQKQELKGLKRAYTYQCNEGFNILAANEECFKQKSVQLQARDCGLNYQIDVDNAKPASKKCNVVNSYLLCLKTEIGRLCGDEAGYFVHNYTVLTLKPFYDPIKCVLGENWDEMNGGLTFQLCPFVFFTTFVAFIINLPLGFAYFQL